AKSSLGLTVSGALNNDQGVLRSDGSLTGRCSLAGQQRGRYQQRRCRVDHYQ
ncbi:hypothetical protein PSYPI_43154, partial [Pseudomonas syringae pv. pisi str. 1704B]